MGVIEMTRKDYIRFAAMFKVARVATVPNGFLTPDQITKGIINATADIFAADNERFDRARFLKACGVES
jgi:hypothetical protein